MKKKIDLFWYWFIFVVAFVLCFFVVNDKKVNAYTLNDEGNLVSDNLFDKNKFSIFYNYIGFDISNLDIGETYTFSTNKPIYWFKISTQAAGFSSVSYDGYLESFTFVMSRNENISEFDTQYLFLSVNSSNIYEPVSNISQLDGYDLQIEKGSVVTPFEPYGTWYSPTNAENMYQGRLPTFTSSLTYTNQDTGVTLTIDNVNSYIDNSFGYLYFDRLWTYLDSLTNSSYDNAKLTINFNENLNINTSYIINSNKQNYGSGVWFYQNNDLMLDVRNFYDNEYCGGASQYTCNVELNKYVNVGSGINSFSYLNKIVVWSSTTDERTLTFGYNNIGYNTGYDNGYIVGYKDGKNVADNLIYNNGYTNGYNVGYDKGVNYASNGGNTLVGLVGAIFTSPVNMLQTIFDFEFLGINLTNFLFSSISLFIVIWLIRKFL